MKQYILSVLSILTLVTVSCNNDPIVQQPTNEINDFTWKAMNIWYNWQEDVPNLADTKDDDIDAYNTFLNGFSTPQDLFQSVLFDQGNTDRFSWFVEDYEIQNQQFQGISKVFGFTRSSPIQINTDGDIIFFLKYVVPGSPADNADIKRGDIIYAIDDVIMNTTNYSELLGNLSNPTVKLSFVTEANGILTPTGDKTITSTVVAANPVHLTKVFDNIGGKKVGYLVYNRFSSSFNEELNASFAELKSQNINEFVLDLRLNPGGSVNTSVYLASMIYAGANTDIFAELLFNSKRSVENDSYSFSNTLNIYNTAGLKTGEESINRLNTLDRLYVLISGGTASASEMVINGLKPFFGNSNVILIGETTYGKNVGSITLYDSGPTRLYTDQSNANPTHKYAMQPIVFQIYNKNGESDYTQGFAPDVKIEEWRFWNNILPFGDENEVLLKAALDDIRGITTKSLEPTFKNTRSLEDSKFQIKFDNAMYIQNDFLMKQ